MYATDALCSVVTRPYSYPLLALGPTECFSRPLAERGVVRNLLPGGGGVQTGSQGTEVRSRAQRQSSRS